MSELLQEFVDSRGATLRIDRREGILHGVKVLGLESRNGRTYPGETLEKAAPLYEGAKVNVNHPRQNPLAPRDYQDRIGNLRNVVVRAGEGLFADFHFNPKHALAEQLLWDAEHAPENVGFSHNVLARTARRGQRTVVEAITKVQSVDLVADPATTQGLFESAAEPVDSPPAPPDAPAAPTAEPREDLVDALLGEQAGQLDTLRGELARTEAELARLRESEAAARRQALIHELLCEAGLPSRAAGPPQPGAAVTERFLQLLAEAPDDQTVHALIRDRAELVEAARCAAAQAACRPRSRDQSALEAPRPTDAASFVKAIT